MFVLIWLLDALSKSGFSAGQQGLATFFNHLRRRMAIIRVESSGGIGSSEAQLSEFPEKRLLIKERSQYSGPATVSWCVNLQGDERRGVTEELKKRDNRLYDYKTEKS